VRLDYREHKAITAKPEQDRLASFKPLTHMNDKKKRKEKKHRFSMTP